MCVHICIHTHMHMHIYIYNDTIIIRGTLRNSVGNEPF